MNAFSPPSIILLSSGDRCRGCRLDKCLLMGMDPKMVQIDGLENDLKTRQFIDSLEEKQREMWQENGMVEEKVQVSQIEIYKVLLCLYSKPISS
jgi:hypothetical protein